MTIRYVKLQTDQLKEFVKITLNHCLFWGSFFYVKKKKMRVSFLCLDYLVRKGNMNF